MSFHMTCKPSADEVQAIAGGCEIVSLTGQQDGPNLHMMTAPLFLPPAPVVLFSQSSPPPEKGRMQSQPISPESASKSKVSSGPAAPRAPIKARAAVRKVAARKTLKRRNPSPDQESLHTSTEDNSSEETQSIRGDSSSGNSGKITTQSQPDLPPSASRKRPVPEPVAPQAPIRAGQGGQRTKSRCIKRARKEPQAPSSNQEASNGCDLSGLLTFDPESIEPAPLRHAMNHDPAPSNVNSSVSKPCFPPRSRHKCQRLNEKKAALDAKTDTSVSTAELETLRKELEDLEERVRATKQLISNKEALIARSQEEAEGLKAQLKTDLAEIRDLHKQLVTGKDEDDEAEIAEVDRVRADALRAFEAFLP
ncbi:hypothetical protein QYE76_019114 [Lolium multiflorum]|uniref:Uncharacterized protein n=1 Tax=Lolium multiflorum TaxID=4521 RepID=A0AAD8R3E0_LOLMU|nr:hypothetical protein QYE76_019114 [Lolium multiflorum]